MRSIDGTVVGNEDRCLNQPLYVVYGTGTRVVDELRFLVHIPPDVPSLSVQRFNPANDTNDDIIVETVRKL